MNIQHFLQTALQALIQVTETPQLEAEVLLAFVLKQNRTYLRAFSERELTCHEKEQAESYLHRRCLKEPLAYILGHKEFWSREFQVTSATLVPRPETELLIELAFKLTNKKQARVADLGTGSGVIGLTLACERPSWHIDATDISEEALKVARNNAQQLELKNVFFHQGSWCTALPDARFDLIVSNPPYLSQKEWPAYASQLMFEPCHALVSGEEGLNAIKEISQSAQFFLKKEGHLLVEHGFLQGERVRELFVQQGYTEVYSVRDLSGHERATIACQAS